ncbi:hypothetical protein [Cronobacter muytjensii]|uniref:hypothetical protein n=1 Tax=Cronobacter muytjensii TaxID=413501 RepID=UPI0020CA4F58|nr:hypothetical protein [Cronobacter muytjensii]
MAEVFLAIVGFVLAIIVIYFIISFQMAREQKFKAAAIRVDARILEMRYSSSSESGSVTYKIKVTFTTDRGPGNGGGLRHVVAAGYDLRERSQNHSDLLLKRQSAKNINRHG